MASFHLNDGLSLGLRFEGLGIWTVASQPPPTFSFSYSKPKEHNSLFDLT